MPQPDLLPASDVVIYTDGGSRGNPGPAAIGVVVLRNDEVVHEIQKCLGQKTNNEAEYYGFASSLDWVIENFSSLQPKSITWKLDSLLVVQQLNKQWKIKEARLALFAQEIWQKMKQLQVPIKIMHVPRAENAHADRLVNAALDAEKC